MQVKVLGSKDDEQVVKDLTDESEGSKIETSLSKKEYDEIISETELFKQVELSELKLDDVIRISE